MKTSTKMKMYATLLGLAAFVVAVFMGLLFIIDWPISILLHHAKSSIVVLTLMLFAYWCRSISPQRGPDDWWMKL